MKKLLSVLTLVAISSSIAVTAAESRVEKYVNQKIAPVTAKEKALNSKVEANKAAAAKQKAAVQTKKNDVKNAVNSKVEANKAAAAKQKAANEAKKTQVKNAIQNEKNTWKNIMK